MGLLRELNPAPRTRSENHATRPSSQVLVDTHTHTHNLTLRLAGSKFRHRCRSPLCRNKRVLMLCDNMAVVMAFNKGRCQNHALLRLTRKLAAFALCHTIFYIFRYVEWARNVADGPNRPDKLAKEDRLKGGETGFRVFVQPSSEKSLRPSRRDTHT